MYAFEGVLSNGIACKVGEEKGITLVYSERFVSRCNLESHSIFNFV